MTSVRPAVAEDRGAIETILRACGAFTPAEIVVALELFDLSMSGRDPSYRFLAADAVGDGLAGYLCFGAVPLTRGSNDLYWIAVDPRENRRGVGRALVERMTQLLRAEGARKIYVETSSRPPYAAARDFYRRVGFKPLALYADFYAAGDDKVVFERDVATPPEGAGTHP